MLRASWVDPLSNIMQSPSLELADFFLPKSMAPGPKLGSSESERGYINIDLFPIHFYRNYYKFIIFDDDC